jgi:polyhydroxyalkanoate synthase
LIPTQDRIVPPASAQALAGALAESPAGTETLVPRLGHIGMMVSAGAEDQVWQPLAGWLTARAGDTEGGEAGG